jgi:hypothetical protein
LYFEPYISFVSSSISTQLIYYNSLQNVDIGFSEKDKGITVGFNLVKYFRLSKKMFLGIYSNLNYNFVNYDNINSRATNNSFGYSLGLSLKRVIIIQ